MSQVRVFDIDKLKRSYTAEALLRTYVMLSFFYFFLTYIAIALFYVGQHIYNVYGYPIMDIIYFTEYSFLSALTGKTASQIYIQAATLIALSLIFLTRSFTLSFIALVIAASLMIGPALHELTSADGGSPGPWLPGGRAQHQLYEQSVVLPAMRQVLLSGLLVLILLFLFVFLRMPFWKPERRKAPISPTPFWQASWLGLLSGSSLGLHRFNCKTKDKIVITLIRGIRAARWGLMLFVPLNLVTMFMFHPEFMAGRIGSIIIAIPIGLLIFWFFEWVLRRFLSKQLIRSSISGRLRKHPKVLFLRSFADDKGDFTSRRDRNRFTSLGRIHASLDGILLDELSAVGTVVALGRPEQGEKSYGASRIQVSDEDWKSEFIETAREAELIVFASGSSESLRWEMTQVRDKGWTGKTIFINPPTYARPENASAFLEEIAQCFGSSILECGERRTPLALAFCGDDINLVTTGKFASDWSYVVSLRHLAHPIALNASHKPHLQP